MLRFSGLGIVISRCLRGLCAISGRGVLRISSIGRVARIGWIAGFRCVGGGSWVTGILREIVLLRRIVCRHVSSAKSSFAVSVEDDASVDQDANKGQADGQEWLAFGDEIMLGRRLLDDDSNRNGKPGSGANHGQDEHDCPNRCLNDVGDEEEARAQCSSCTLNDADNVEDEACHNDEQNDH